MTGVYQAGERRVSIVNSGSTVLPLFLSTPKTPEQNGVAERMNRTLVETVRAMLADTKLPHKFWAEAVSTAVYLRNRSPSKAVKGMTPYEAWTGERPNVNHL